MMRFQLKTLLIFLSPLVLAVTAAYFQWAVFGLPTIPPAHNRLLWEHPRDFQGGCASRTT